MKRNYKCVQVCIEITKEEDEEEEQKEKNVFSKERIGLKNWRE